ncbi:MAG: rhomboid family intramembrane serine protease [Planctomycetota bacterium]|nr:rhomboid family intramembrane serine protease [Planctomycetota bacterium]
MLIPSRTTTPLSYFPTCTLAIVAVALFVHGLVVAGLVDRASLALQYGAGLRPLEWITSNFLHGNVVHLIGNMVFLWVFGQIVEARLGPWRFLLVFVGIGALECALEQMIMLGAGRDAGVSYGASAIIYGLLTMSVLWAPFHRRHVFYSVFIRFGAFEISTISLALVYIALEVSQAWLDSAAGYPLGSAVLHLAGAAIGLGVGIALLRTDLVEKDGKDLVSWWKGRGSADDRASGSAARTAARSAARTTQSHAREMDVAQAAAEERQAALEGLRDALAAGDARGAWALYDDAVRRSGSWPLPERVLRALILGLQKEESWREVKPLLVDSIRRFPRGAAVMKLVLARLLIDFEKRPSKGAEILGTIPEGSLAPSQEDVRHHLLQKAERLSHQGVRELDFGEDL